VGSGFEDLKMGIKFKSSSPDPTLGPRRSPCPGTPPWGAHVKTLKIRLFPHKKGNLWQWPFTNTGSSM